MSQSVRITIRFGGDASYSPEIEATVSRSIPEAVRPEYGEPGYGDPQLKRDYEGITRLVESLTDEASAQFASALAAERANEEARVGRAREAKQAEAV